MAFKALILSLLIGVQASACQWSTITRNEDGSYRYPRLCHIEVGKSLTKLDLLEEKVSLLEKKLSYTEDIVKLERTRSDMWVATAQDLDKQVNKLEKERYLYAIGGAVVTILTIYLTGVLL